MSYSFQFKASSKAAAKAQAEVEFDKVITFQPSHSVDKVAALANAGAMIDLLPDDDGKDVTVTMNGSLGGPWENGAYTSLTSAAASASAYLIAREA